MKSLLPALLLVCSFGLGAAPAVEKTAGPNAEDAYDAAVSFLRARVLARSSRTIDLATPPKQVGDEERPVWLVTVKFTEPAYGQPVEATLYVDGRTGGVIEDKRRIDAMLTHGNPDHLARLAQHLEGDLQSLSRYLEWADYFAFRGNARHIRLFEERAAALSVFEPDGRSDYRLLFTSPRRIDEARAFAALLPDDARIVALGRLCPGTDPIAAPLIMREVINAPAFARMIDAQSRFGCGNDSRLYSLVVDLNHRDGERVAKVAEGLIAVMPMVTTWSNSPAAP